MNSPHKGPVTRKMFPFDDVITCDGNLYHWGPHCRACPCRDQIKWARNISSIQNRGSILLEIGFGLWVLPMGFGEHTARITAVFCTFSRRFVNWNNYRIYILLDLSLRWVLDGCPSCNSSFRWIPLKNIYETYSMPHRTVSSSHSHCNPRGHLVDLWS